MISNLGNVKSVDRTVISSNQVSNFTFHRKSAMIKPFVHPDGYIRVTLYNDDNKRKTLLLHRLVAIAFLPNPNNLPEVNHLDRNKSNICVTNLEWCTKRENMEHAYRNGYDPGACSRGKTFSPEHCERISKALSGRIITNEWKHHMSVGHVNQQKSVRCIEDDLTFRSIQAAANFYGMCRDAVADSVRLHRTTKFGKTFERIYNYIEV